MYTHVYRRVLNYVSMLATHIRSRTPVIYQSLASFDANIAHLTVKNKKQKKIDFLRPWTP